MDSDSSSSIEVTIAAPGWAALVTDPHAFCRTAALAALCHAGPPPGRALELSILLTDDDRVRELNRVWRHQDRATNVLSFPSGAEDLGLPSGVALPLGDLALALETVEAEAAGAGRPAAHHIAHLVVHGVLHLLGHDHEASSEAEIMESLETAILAELDIPDPWADDAP